MIIAIVDFANSQFLPAIIYLLKGKVNRNNKLHEREKTSIFFLKYAINKNSELVILSW